MIPIRLLPECARAGAFIAGGFAACASLAEDVDVWIPIDPFGDPWDATHNARNLVVAYLRQEFGDKFIEQDKPGTPRGDKKDWERNRLLSTHEGYNLPIPIYRAGSVVGLGSLPYHVIVVGGDVDEVLSSFDISTHQVALHPERGLIKGEHWTPITEHGYVLKNKYSTASRLTKLAARYKWPEIGIGESK